MDGTFSSTPLALWRVFEPTLGVVNACLPVMRLALQRILGYHGILLWTLFSTRNPNSKPSKGNELLGGLAVGENGLIAGHGNDLQRQYDERRMLGGKKQVVQAEGIENFEGMWERAEKRGM